MEEWLSARAGRRVAILVPRRGDKRALLDLATRNAELAYRTRFDGTRPRSSMRSKRFGRPRPAGCSRRIECFDISTIQGSETVASMVVCEAGE